MSVDLKGNTNFVVLKNLQDELIVPRTNLAAVDMAVANGLSVAGSTLSITMATTEDIELGTSGSVVTPDALKPILDSKQLTLEAGTGVELVAGETASTISVPLAAVETLIDGTTATKVVDVAALRGALTTGQAVDVTSAPDGVTGDYLGSFTVTGSLLGFAAFPKYAKNLNYLFIATIVPTTAGTVTPSANCKWLDTGDRAAKSVAAGVSVKLAVTFTSSANTCPASFALSGTGSVTVSYCRQYEVTACTAESIAYIASLSNPDAFADYYLVKADMVQPWTYIIDMGTSPAVTVAAGLSYKLNASTGTHTLTVDTCPVGYDGRDAIIRITLGGSGVVQAVAPLQLGGALVPYAINNCVVRFRDGEAVLLVEDTLAGYVVTVTSGTDSGSLAYGLAATGIPYIAFSTSTDGQVVDMGNAVTANEEVTVVGNGYTTTTITGNITCTNKTTVANLGLQDVTVAGGTLTLGDAYIPSGSTVAVSGGGLAVEKVTGNGGVIDLGGTNIKNGGTPLFASGVSFTGGLADRGGAIRATGKVDLVDCVISGNTCTEGGAAVFIYYTNNIAVNLTGCTVTGNTGTNTLSVVGTSAGYNLSSCHIGENQDIRLVSATDYTTFAGSNTFLAKFSGSGTVTLTSGAILDLTGNSNPTPINPGGGITFESGGATVKVGSGTASSSYMLDNVTLPAGAKLTNTAVVDLGGTHVVRVLKQPVNVSGCTFTSGVAYTSTDNKYGGAFSLNQTTGVFSNCQFIGNNGNISDGRGGGIYAASGSGQEAILSVVNCVFTDNVAYQGNAIYTLVPTTIQDCVFNANQSLYIRDTTATFVGTNVLKSNVAGNGSIIFANGATLDLTGNSVTTPIAPGGGIKVQQTASIVYGTAENPTTGTMVFDSGTNPHITQIASGGVIVTDAASYPYMKGLNNSITNLGLNMAKTISLESASATGITLSNVTFYASGVYTGTTNTTAQVTIGGTMVKKSGAMNFVGVPGGTATVLPNTVLDISSTTAGTYIVNAALLNIGSNVSIVQVGGTTVSVNGGSAGSFVPASGNTDVRLLPNGTTNGDEA